MSDSSILIKNIYYMLSYAFRVLKESNYDSVSKETFENIYDLFAAILSKGIIKQIKQGLNKEYIEHHNHLTTLKGKLDINDTIKNKIKKQNLLVCDYDELSVNNTLNQILKTTVDVLLKKSNIKPEYRISLKKSLLFMSEIDVLEPSTIKWSRLQFHRNNASYRMLINLCYYILDGLLISTEKGDYKFANFIDDQKMSTLFEKFVLEYYRYHHKSLKADPSHVAWSIDEGKLDLLPTMKTDISLYGRVQRMIIDTKYYSKSLSVREEYDSVKIHSNNLYQIFTYVKNSDKNNQGNVEGILLYAKTDELITPDASFILSGNKISVKTLDLNVSFTSISNQLDNLVKDL